MSERSLTADALLQHEPFVRAVVRGLLTDEARVQDVLQETWLTALRRPPRDAGALRSWLARVASNLAKDSHRGRSRRMIGHGISPEKGPPMPTTREILPLT